VAIIGGGWAGLSCAEHLVSSSLSSFSEQTMKSPRFDVTVFDTGRLRPGGRGSSRQPQDPEKDNEQLHHPILSKFRYDHAAQILTVPKPEQDPLGMFQAWRKQVQKWEQAGIVQRFPSNKSIYRIRSPRDVQPMEESEEFYYGTQGIGSIAESIVRQNAGTFQLHQNVWISPSHGVKYIAHNIQNQPSDPKKSPATKTWRVQDGKRVLGEFDILIIAHNGKCADRLMSQTPAKQIHSLLRVSFQDRVPNSGGTKMTLNSLYSLTFAIPKDYGFAACLPPDFVCGFLQSPAHRSISFLTCQTRKYVPDDDTHCDPNVDVWTVFSSSAFAKRNKAPQEFLPSDVIQNVTETLLAELQDLVDRRHDETQQSTRPNLTNSILESRLQLWGAAIPLNVWEFGSRPAGFLYDAQYNVGVCGDWLVDPSLAGAWTSGRLLAEYIRQKHSQDHSSHAIDRETGSFRKSASANQAAIGSISLPTSNKNEPRNMKKKKNKVLLNT
jgi:predicted NAD/FAD-dependent oxidoreductase